MAAVRWVVGAASLALCTALVGCTDEPATPEPTATASPTPTPSPTDGPVSLRFTVYGGEAVVEAYQKIADAYTAANPEVTIEVTDVSDAAAAAESTRGQLVAGDGPDVFLLDQFSLPEFVEGGYLQPVDRLLEDRGLQYGDDYQRTALTAFSANSGLQCMPMEQSPYVVFYNQRLLPPDELLAQGVQLPEGTQSWDWAEFEATARVAAAQARGGTVKGAYIQADLNLLTAFLRSAGTDVVDSLTEPTSLTLTSDAATETIRSIAELTQDRTVSLTPREIVGVDPLTRFRQGRLAMYIGTKAIVPSLRATKGLQFDVLPLPSFGRFRAVSEINGLCLNGAGDQVEEAADFIAFAVSSAGAAIASSSGAMVPSAVAALLSDEFVGAGLQPANSEVLVNAVRKSEPMPYSTAWNDVAAQAAGVLTRIYLNPAFDLDDRLVPRLEKLNARSVEIFTGEPAAE